jgi:hypothetical protein
MSSPSTLVLCWFEYDLLGVSRIPQKLGVLWFRSTSDLQVLMQAVRLFENAETGLLRQRALSLGLRGRCEAMVASTALRELSFAEMKRLCYSGLDAPTLLHEVARRLRRVVPFEAYCATSNDPLSGLLTHVAHDGVFGDKQQRTYLADVFFEEDLDEQRRMVRNRSPVALLSDVTGGKLEHALRHREITGPLGLGYELLGVCSLGREHWGGINLIRESSAPDFDTRESALLHRIVPRLGTGLKAAVLCKQASAEPERESAPGVLVLDDPGRMVQHTQAAERWLRASLTSETAGKRARDSLLPCGWR